MACNVCGNGTHLWRAKITTKNAILSDDFIIDHDDTNLVNLAISVRIPKGLEELYEYFIWDSYK